MPTRENKSYCKRWALLFGEGKKSWFLLGFITYLGRFKQQDGRDKILKLPASAIKTCVYLTKMIRTCMHNMSKNRL